MTVLWELPWDTSRPSRDTCIIAVSISLAALAVVVDAVVVVVVEEEVVVARM